MQQPFSDRHVTDDSAWGDLLCTLQTELWPAVQPYRAFLALAASPFMCCGQSASK